jgi:hypothetical protein
MSQCYLKVCWFLLNQVSCAVRKRSSLSGFSRGMEREDFRLHTDFGRGKVVDNFFNGRDGPVPGGRLRVSRDVDRMSSSNDALKHHKRMCAKSY